MEFARLDGGSDPMNDSSLDLGAIAAFLGLESAAWHEAGHAAAAALLGVGFKGARIGDSDTGEVFGFTSPSPRSAKWQLKHDVVAMAGPRAEHNWSPSDRSPESRVGWAQDIEYFGGDHDRKARAWDLAGRLLTPHVEGVKRVKQMLLDQPAVSAAEVRAVVSKIDIKAWP